MAWTKTIGIGSYGSQLRVTVDLLSQNTAANRSYIRVRIEAYNGGISRTYNTGSGADWAISGTASASGSQTFNIPGRSWYTFADQNFTVDHDSAGNLSLSITGRLSNTGTTAFGNGGSATVTASLPRLVLAPTAPSWGSTSYSAPGSIRVTWTNRATARGPYSSLELQRWRTSLGKWYALGTLSSTASSYTDSSLPANEEVRYRVRAKGPGGTSAWATGGTMGTVPAAPSGVKAVKSGLAIRVSWTDNAAMQGRTRTFLIEDRPGGGSWVQVGSIGSSATSWTHNDADPAVTHQYRVRARTTSGGLDHTSGYSSASAVVQLQAAPKQPSRVGPKDSVALVIGEPVDVVWTHNPVDTTEQTAAEVQWRVDGGSWTTVPVTGSANTVAITPGTGSATRARLEWRVRTKGDHPDWSPWSAINGPVLSTVPAAVIQVPVSYEPLTTSRVAVSWAYEPGGDEVQLGQAAFAVELVRAGDVVEETAGGTGTAVDLESRLANGVEYTVRVRVRNGDALWSAWDESVFRTNFPVPAEVEVFPQWDRDDASVSLGFGESEALRATYRWTGEPGASTSEAVDADGNVVATNLVRNPFGPGMTNTDGWRSTAGDRLEVVEDEGRPVARFVQGTDGTGFYLDPPDNFVWPVGSVVRWSVEIKVTQPVSQVGITLSTYQGAAIDQTFADPGPRYVEQEPDDGWVRYVREGVITAMPDTGWVRCLVWPNGTGVLADESILIRDAIVTVDAPDGVGFFDGDTVGTTDVEGIDVERRDDGGDWVLIASGIPSSTTITDRTPRIGDVEYRAISRTALPTETIGPVAATSWPFPVEGAYVSGGPGFGRVCVGAGASATDSPGIEQSTKKLAGVKRPVAFFGEGRTHDLTYTGTIPLPPNETPVSTRDEWEALLYEYGVVCYRDPMGRKRFGIMGLSFSQDGPIESVTVDVEEVHWTESVRRVTDHELEERA